MTRISENRGITLLALIVTIIVLLILSGISIAMLTGDNGIYDNAVTANRATRAGEVKERVALEVSNNQILKYTNRTEKTRDEVIAELQAEGKLTAEEVEELGSSETPVITIGGITIDFSVLPEKVQTWTQDGTSVTDGEITLTVGQAVSGYEVEGYESLNWCVLGAKDGKLLITTSANTETIELSGKDGYTGGVETLNTAAAKYSDGDLADSVRTIDVDDINRVTGYDPATAGYGSGNVGEYGDQVTYTKKTDGKIWYQGSKQPTTQTTSSYTSFEYWNGTNWISLGEEESATLTSTSYWYSPNTLTTSDSGETNGIATDSDAYTLLFANTGGKGQEDKAIWLGSPCVDCFEGRADFGLRYVMDGYVNNGYLYYSDGNTYSGTYGLRPAVSLKSNVKVTSAGVVSK